jgi:orotate phosphoribosyltransferase
MGITVSDVIVLVDREAGVTRKMEQFGVRVHAVLKISYLARRLLEQNHITQEIYESIDKYLAKE